MGDVKCVHPGCEKLMNVKKSQLCQRHHEDQEAPSLLRVYLDSYTSPFPQNERYFAELASGVTNVGGEDFRRLRAFGRFLQTYELPEALTWEAIEDALPPSGQSIRSCLFQLGYLFADRGKMDGWHCHLDKRAVRRALERAPQEFSHHVSGFQQWLLDGSVNPKLQLSAAKNEPLSLASRTLVERINMVATFLSFCVTHNTLTLAEINPALISTYQQTLLWQFECKKCGNRIGFTTSRLTGECPQCNGLESYVRTRRLARGTLISYMSVLRIFFDWAKLEGIVIDNPISTICCGGAKSFTVRGDNGEMVEVAEAIRRYDDTVVEKLCAYIVSPRADPEEAMVLYLIIFHALTNAELRNLRIPSLVNAGSGLRDTSPAAEDFEHLHLPSRQISRGNRLLTRTDAKIILAPKALEWLIPILRRFYEKRGRIVKSKDQQHFLVGEENVFRNKPVTKSYVTRIVGRASSRALGAVVSPSDLRRTAADMFAQKSKLRGAILTKMGFSSLSATRFNYLERFPLQPKMAQSTDKNARQPGA